MNPPQHAPSPTPLVTVDADHPWLGLAAFTEDTQRFFFGRDAEIAEIFVRVRDNTLTILYGQSGLGKSSLLGAGLLPKLRVEEYRPVQIRLRYEPTDPPLIDQVFAELEKSNLLGAHRPATLWEWLHNRENRPQDFDARPPVLVFDQFEEIFTLGQRAERLEETRALFTQLAELIENRSPAALRARFQEDRRLARDYDNAPTPARLVITLREDFLSHLEQWKKILPSLMKNRMALDLLDGPQALEAVVRPGRMEGRNLVDEEVGAAIVRFVAKKEAHIPLEEIGAVPPLLSLVCDELNRLRLAKNLPTITAGLVETQSSDILNNFYLESFANLPDNVRHFIEDRLITEGGHRNPVAQEDALTAFRRAGVENPAAALDQLVAHRLISPEERGGLVWIEITHDVLAPLVVRARDERLERERAAEAERKEFEARKARNKLRFLLSLFSILTLLAIAGAILASVKTREATLAEREAQKQTRAALAATDAAQARFESAVKSLQDTYETYKGNVFDQMPNIYLRHVRKFLQPLREQTLLELERLHTAQPKNRDCLIALCKVYLDEIKQARVESDWERADKLFRTAEGYYLQIQKPSLVEIEMLSDLIIWKAIIPYYRENDEAGNRVTNEQIEKISVIIQEHPDSWRLRYVNLRLKFARAFGVYTLQEYLQLESEMANVLEASGGSFDVAMWRILAAMNAYNSKSDWNTMPLAEVERLIDVFRTTLLVPCNGLANNSISRLQLEEAGWRLDSFVSRTSYRLVGIENDPEIKEKQRILISLDKLLTDIEDKLPLSDLVYATRTSYFLLEKKCLDTGTGFRSKEALEAQTQRHNQRGLVVGVPTIIQNAIKQSLDIYTSEKATLEEKEAALVTLRFASRDVTSLDIDGLGSALGDTGAIGVTSEKIGKLAESDPVMVPLHAILSRYIQITSQAEPSMRASRVSNFAGGTLWLVELWNKNGSYEQIRSYWTECYGDIDLSTKTQGDQNSLIKIGGVAANAFLKSNDWDTAKQIHRQMTVLAETVLSERPWDWYLRNAFFGMNFELAAALKNSGRKSEAQPLLHSAWKVIAEMHGIEINFEKFSTLPFKGEIPEGANEDEVLFFTRFKTKEDGGSTMKMFVIPCDVNGTKVPVQFYILSGKNGYSGILDQFRWVKEYRGVDVPADVQDSLKKLSDIATQNKVDFLDLCTYALNYPTDDKKLNDSKLDKKSTKTSEYRIDFGDDITKPTVKTPDWFKNALSEGKKEWWITEQIQKEITRYCEENQYDMKVWTEDFRARIAKGYYLYFSKQLENGATKEK